MPGGREPDPRFTLANERTFLAWTRTSLAFLAGGIALAALPLADMPQDFKRLLAIVLLCIGTLLAIGSAVRWVRVERAMRHDRPLPLPLIVPFMAVVASATCVGTVLYLVM
nr:DUF202 domain-containing protein [Brevibacterium yomogidense]